MCLAPKVGSQTGAVFPTAQNSTEWAYGRRPADVSPEAWAARVKGEAAARPAATGQTLGANFVTVNDKTIGRSVAQAQRNWWKDNPNGYQAQTGDVADAAVATDTQRRRRLPTNTTLSGIANGAANVGANTLLGN